LPFYTLFYVEAKGADPLIIGAMGTLGTLGALLFLAPFGRLADKYGRKKIIYLTRPFNYLSIFIIVLAPTPEWLIVAAFVRALNTVSSLMEITMEHELVAEEQRGRWGGFLSFFMGFVGIPGPILAGYLWNVIDPSLLLLTPIVADLPFLAILPTIPDTLHMDYEQNDTLARARNPYMTSESLDAI
jgi:MFS family permease